MLTVSIIMAAYNSESTIERAIKSFLAQDYQNKELIVVDGASKDRTCEIVENFMSPNIRLYSKQDSGIYDAINNGISFSRGDVIGILHSNDFYATDTVLSEAMQQMTRNDLDAIYADVEFFEFDEKTIVRRYSSRLFTPDMLKYGIMPAHPTLFLRKSIFEEYGSYRTDLKISADFDFIARIFKSSGISWKYVPEVWMKMKIGGASTSGLKSTLLLNREIIKACRTNGIKTSWGRILLRYFWKVFELSSIRRKLFLR